MEHWHSVGAAHLGLQAGLARALHGLLADSWANHAGHYGTVHCCHGVYRSGPNCRASVVLFTVVMLCVQVWPYMQGLYGTFHYCHAVYRSGSVCWATMVLFTVVMLCIQVWPSLLGHCGTIHSLLSWSVSRSDPMS